MPEMKLKQPVPEYGNMYRWSKIENFILAEKTIEGQKFYLVKFQSSEGPVGTGVLYRLLTAKPPAISSDDIFEDIGGIEFFRIKEGDLAIVRGSNIIEAYQRRGLGKFLYKTAINDLVSEGWAVQSDWGRSPAAEALWLSIARDNPGQVKMVPAGPGDAHDAYFVRTPVRRRPNVRRYRRRA